MNNDELMQSLSQIRKNYNHRNTVIVLGFLAGAGILGCYKIYMKYQYAKKQLGELKLQVSEQDNTIRQLIIEKEIKDNDYIPGEPQS